MPTIRSAESLSFAVTLESAGLMHFVVRRAEGESVANRDHTVVYKGTREVNGTSQSSRQHHRSVVGGTGEGVAKPGGDGVAVVETVEGLEPNATYEV